MKRLLSITLVSLVGFAALTSQACSCSPRSSSDLAPQTNRAPESARIAPLPRKNVPRLPLRRSGPLGQRSIDEHYQSAVPAAALAYLDAQHETGPATHGMPAGTRRAERLSRLLDAAEAELSLDRQTRAGVSLIISRFDAHRHALRQSERRGALTRVDAQSSLGVLLRERNFMLRDYLGRERARRIFQLERAQRAAR